MTAFGEVRPGADEAAGRQDWIDLASRPQGDQSYRGPIPAAWNFDLGLDL